MWANKNRIGKGRRYGLLGVSTLVLLAGCDWLGGGAPANTAKVRPGAERQVVASNSLPPAGTGRQYDAGIAPVDETRSGPQIGSIVATKGGQKAQLEAAQKEAAKRDAEARTKAREQSEREVKERAAEKAGKATEPAQPVAPPQPPITTSPVPPPGPATEAPAGPATPPPAAPAPVTQVPEPAPAPVASTPTKAVDPNKAFEPPLGWVPLGQSAPVVTTVAAPPPTTPAPVPAPVVATPSSLPTPAVTTAAAEPPSIVTSTPVAQPALQPAPAAAPRARKVDPKKAFEPPPDWTPPVPTAALAMASAAPTPPPATAPVVARPLPETSPAPQPTVAQPAPPPTAQPPTIVEADIPKARSGAVPFGAITSPPFGGQMQVAVIQFGYSSAELGGNDLAVLSRVAQIQKHNGGTVRIVAHAAKDVTDASAAEIERGNYEISHLRALAIANHLMQLGVPRSAIVAEAASDGKPLYDTNTARGIAANRRAEVYLDL